MKKLLLVAAIAAFALTSCKKTYVCECTTASKVLKGTEFKASKKDADANCLKGNTTSQGNTTTCIAVAQ